MKSFEERVREEIGEGSNPAAYEWTLTCSDEELFHWLVDWHTDLVPTMQETQAYMGNEARRGTLELGTRILEGQFRAALFVIRELQGRVRAVTQEPA